MPAPNPSSKLISRDAPWRVQAARELRLQLKVCRDHDDLGKYLNWLRRDPSAAAAARSAPWRLQQDTH